MPKTLDSMVSPSSDVIAAIATAPGVGGIGVVRISGPTLANLAERLAGKLTLPRRVTSTNWRAVDGSVIDQGLMIYFPAPQSFTGEDVLELHGHGGPVVMQMLLARVVELGARLAEPGEFTRRAFLNDKLDLAQAEAVADLISATTTAAARSAVRSLSGEFSASIHALTKQVIELRMLIEATLDFPDEEIDVITDTNAVQRLAEAQENLNRLLLRAKQGSILRSGLRVVLVGLPNVGKSSLLNCLAGEDRALVTAIAGTTRDAIKETIEVQGIPLHIIDTAGLRQSDDPVEQLGIARTWREIENADVILQMVDARHGLTIADEEVAQRLPAMIERIIVANKVDLTEHLPRRNEMAGQVHLWMSAQTGAGLKLLHDELLRVAGWVGHGEDVILARERHLIDLKLAAEKLACAEQKLGQLEFCAEELRLAQAALSDITGEFSADDLLGEIFSRFCIGK